MAKKNLHLIGEDDQNNLLTGDFSNDQIIGGNNNASSAVSNELFGDVGGFNAMSGSDKGGNDNLIGGDNKNPNASQLTNDIYGDAASLQGSSRGGNDNLIGGSNSGAGSVNNVLWGEGRTLQDSSHGGNDNLIGGNNTGAGRTENEMFGEGAIAFGTVKCGSDSLVGGNSSGGLVFNKLYGDTSQIGDNLSPSDADCGDDTLVGGSASVTGSAINFMVGDAEKIVSGNPTLGDDTLVAGTASTGSFVSNEMVGDVLQPIPSGSNPTFGHDTFVFQDNVAAGLTVGTFNTIRDFQQGLDVIKFIGVAGVSSYNDLVLADDGFGHTLIIAGGDQVDVTNVTFTGPNTLTAADFLFG